MAHALRPLLRHCPKWHQCRSSHDTFHLFLSSRSPLVVATTTKHSFRCLHFTSLLSARRTINSRPRGLSLSDSRSSVVEPSERHGSDSESEADSNKSRNERKREARRAVAWGMDLATFSNTRIRRILRAVSLDQEQIFDAIMLAKRLGSDVREGKRRQFNYIGKLLRNAKPDLMDGLIKASKASDHSKFHQLSASSGPWIIEDSYEEDEGPYGYIDMANRWIDGLIAKDVSITNEVYSVNSVDFDRQELRQLVRKVHSAQEQQLSGGENAGQLEASLLRAKRSLTRFLMTLAKQFATVQLQS